MAKRVTKEMLQSVVDRINRITDSPIVTYTRDEATGNLKGNIGNFHIDSAYSGVALGRIANEGAATSFPMGQAYYSKRELLGKMYDFISGIEFNQVNK